MMQEMTGARENALLTSPTASREAFEAVQGRWSRKASGLQDPSSQHRSRSLCFYVQGDGGLVPPWILLRATSLLVLVIRCLAWGALIWNRSLAVEEDSVSWQRSTPKRKRAHANVQG